MYDTRAATHALHWATGGWAGKEVPSGALGKQAVGDRSGLWDVCRALKGLCFLSQALSCTSEERRARTGAEQVLGHAGQALAHSQCNFGPGCILPENTGHG